MFVNLSFLIETHKLKTIIENMSYEKKNKKKKTIILHYNIASVLPK